MMQVTKHEIKTQQPKENNKRAHCSKACRKQKDVKLCNKNYKRKEKKQENNIR